MEEWRDVVGYEGLYKVSNTGKIMSLHKGTKLGKDGGNILKTNLNNVGYETVVLYKDKVRSTKTVHRIVATAFIPNPNNYETINHKDECKTNNCVDNLEWCSYGYNNAYGSARIRSVLAKSTTVAQMNCDGIVIAKYLNSSIAAEIIGVTKPAIISACKRRGSCKGYLWKYIDEEL